MRSRRYNLFNTTISKKMTNKQLQSYIRQATTEINKTIGKRGTGSEQLDKSIKWLQKSGGVKKVKDKNKNVIEQVGFNFKGKKKDDLLRQARMLKQHIAFDIETREGKEFFKEKQLRAYTNFKKLQKNISKAEYVKLVDIMGSLQNSLIKDLPSKHIVNLIISSGGVSSSDFIDIVTDVIKETKGDGLTTTQLLDAIYERLQEVLS